MAGAAIRLATSRAVPLSHRLRTNPLDARHAARGMNLSGEPRIWSEAPFSALQRRWMRVTTVEKGKRDAIDLSSIRLQPHRLRRDRVATWGRAATCGSIACRAVAKSVASGLTDMQRLQIWVLGALRLVAQDIRARLIADAASASGFKSPMRREEN